MHINNSYIKDIFQSFPTLQLYHFISLVYLSYLKPFSLNLQYIECNEAQSHGSTKYREPYEMDIALADGKMHTFALFSVPYCDCDCDIANKLAHVPLNFMELFTFSDGKQLTDAIASAQCEWTLCLHNHRSFVVTSRYPYFE